MVRRFPGWLPFAGLACSLILAWPNVLLTGRWASIPGALNGPRRPFYLAALAIATIILILNRRRVGSRVTLGRPVVLVVLAAGLFVYAGALLSRIPPWTWGDLPFKDNWTMLFQQAVNGVHLMKQGSVVGWNWWLQGGYPTSTDIAQNFGALAILPMTLFGDRIGYHVLHVIMFLSLPLFVWWDVRQDDRRAGILAAGLTCFLGAGYMVTIGNSGDTNSLAGVFSAALALAGSRAARLGRWWGGPVLLLGLTFALYSHTAFFVYSGILLVFEALYFRDWSAVLRAAAAGALALVAAMPLYWESLRYPAYVSFNNTVFEPGAPTNWPLFFRTLYYNIEILALPHRWFNDYRSIANVWLPALVVAALQPRSRLAFYACAAVLIQFLLRLNTPEAGAMFDRIQHMFPIIAGPALAGVVLAFSGTRAVAFSLLAVMGLYVATTHAPVRHVEELRDFDPPLIDRIVASDGMVLVELSPHRDMDSHPVNRTQTTPFDVHFEGLLPTLAGQRFYSQAIDGWVWNIWRGQVVGAGTYNGRPIGETPLEEFAGEMRKWGVKHLFVWTDITRDYLAASPQFVERWREGRWSHFELPAADVDSVVTRSGSARLTNLDFFGGHVELSDVTAGDPVVVRANFYPAWRAYDDGMEVALFAQDCQMAFEAPRSGSYVVRLEYPRYYGLQIVALLVFVGGLWLLRRWPRAIVTPGARMEASGG
jgi:hypothetical protein